MQELDWDVIIRYPCQVDYRSLDKVQWPCIVGRIWLDQLKGKVRDRNDVVKNSTCGQDLSQYTL